LTFFTSWALTKTVLKGEVSAFTLELPPYRPPQILQTLYRSIIDRTIFVLWRAVIFALPAGAAIWLVSHIHVGDTSLAMLMIEGLDPLAGIMGLTGVILLAYVVAIPANEIVVPTILMLTVMQTGMAIEGFSGAGVMFETDEGSALSLLLTAGGWTTLTAICLMIFSLCHNPCSTTLFTIYRETRSWKWTAYSAIIPTAYGVILCMGITGIWRLFN
jgi:ferrous iron transport protein B